MRGKLNKVLIFASFVALITFSNCSLDVPEGGKNLIGEGPLVTKYISADSFNIFQHLAVGSVNIFTGDSLEISIRAQQNIIDEMAFGFAEGIFAWGFYEQVNIAEADTILLTIKMPNAIEAIQIGGLGSIMLSGEKQESILFDVVGVGEILSYALEVDVCEMYVTGQLFSRVMVNNEIKGSISGGAEIFFKGDPEINVDIRGGDINFHDDN